MINRNTLIALAAATLVLFVAAGLIGEDNDFLGIVDDIVWIGFIACALGLVVLSVGVLVRSVARSRSRDAS
jgi:predicted tellurium resistance membrane protein TerC